MTSNHPFHIPKLGNHLKTSLTVITILYLTIPALSINMHQEQMEIKAMDKAHSSKPSPFSWLPSKGEIAREKIELDDFNINNIFHSVLKEHGHEHLVKKMVNSKKKDMDRFVKKLSSFEKQLKEKEAELTGNKLKDAADLDFKRKSKKKGLGNWILNKLHFKKAKKIPRMSSSRGNIRDNSNLIPPKNLKVFAQSKKSDKFKHLNDDKFIPRVKSILPPKVKEALILKLKKQVAKIKGQMTEERIKQFKKELIEQFRRYGIVNAR